MWRFINKRASPMTAASQPSDTIAELKALNAQFITNFVTNDVVSHDRLLHPDFLYIRGNGARIDRATYLRNWATGFDPDVILYWDVRDEVITLAGAVALVRSANKCIERVNGREVISMSVYTDIYIQENGRWLCLQAQITPIAPGHEPPDATIISVWLKGVKQEQLP